MTWQPIETAPNDGTPILVANSLSQWVARGPSEAWTVNGKPAEFWRCDLCDKTSSAATHWMPLPALPQVR
jgi:hypothetical protein